MNLYIYINIIIILVYTKFINGKLKITTSFEPVDPWSTCLQFLTKVNNTSDDDYDVIAKGDQCCLEDDRGVNCDILAIIGGCVDRIPRGTTKTLKLIAPLIDPYERKGYCLAFIDSQRSDKHVGITRDAIKINFDTRFKNKEISENSPKFLKRCTKVDEDPLNECRSVNCETFYNEKKSHFSKNLKRCVEVPSCYDNPESELPNVLYDPVSNLCITGDTISHDDISFIKSIVNGNSRKTKDILIIKNDKSDSNDSYLGDRKLEIYNKANEQDEVIQANLENKDKFYINNLLKSCTQNTYTIVIFGIVITVQCCLIVTMIYFLVKNCTCCSRKKIISKFFNYRQDASVTTPLIFTSNIDTETTDYHYFSESSNNINNKIKCYKACQKELKDAAQMSMSDDILTKCLNRRDWITKTSKSDPVVETPKGSKEKLNRDIKESKFCVKETVKVINEKSKHLEEKNNKKYTERKFKQERSDSLVYEHEKNNKDKTRQNNIQDRHEKKKEERVLKTKKEDKVVKQKLKKPMMADKSLVTKDEKKTSFDPTLAQADSDDIRALSEKEIRCHNYFEEKNVTGFMPRSRDKRAAMVKTDRNLNYKTASTEKGAQAYFSNDSVEDYLSERGLVYLTGENISKYSFSSQSEQPKSSSISEVTSKTSKNMTGRNYLELLKVSKQTSSSDPGAVKPEPMDLQMLHISKASMTSSTDNPCVKNLQSLNSRTSL